MSSLRASRISLSIALSVSALTNRVSLYHAFLCDGCWAPHGQHCAMLSKIIMPISTKVRPQLHGITPSTLYFLPSTNRRVSLESTQITISFIPNRVSITKQVQACIQALSVCPHGSVTNLQYPPDQRDAKKCLR